MSEIENIKLQAMMSGCVVFESDLAILEVAQKIGPLLCDPVSKQLVDLIDNSEKSLSNPSHLSYSRPRFELPFHTDYPNLPFPPRFVLLHCVDEGDLSIATEYVSFWNYSESLFFNALVNEPWLIFQSDNRWHVCRILQILKNRQILMRLSTNVMKPLAEANSALKILTDNAHRIFQSKKFVLRTGQYALLDNWSGLHRRTLSKSSVDLIDSRRVRILERVLISHLGLN